MDTQTFWNEVGSQKDFEDPFYLEKLEKFINKDSTIVEYGCGYGRLLNILDEKGYKNIRGFDFAPKMIERGLKTNPKLNLTLIEESGKVPLADGLYDAVVMSTILCCMVDKKEQVLLLKEMQRMLKKGGVLYLSDFLVCDEKYAENYQKGFDQYNDWGIYTTNEGVVVRHHTTKWIMRLLEDWDIQWFEQFDFKTMNNNYAKTFHCIAQR